MSITATSLLQLLIKRAQEAELPDPEIRDENYSHSRLLPPLAGAPAPAPVAPVAKPIIPPVAPLPQVKRYIPPLQPGQQTLAQRQARDAAIKAQHGQGVLNSPGSR